MQFKANKTELKTAVQNAQKAVPAKSTIPALTAIKCELDNNNLKITGYDLEMGITTNIPVESFDNGAFLADAKIFANMIAKAPQEDIEIFVDDNNIKIVSGKVNFTLAAMPANEYPALPNIEESDKITIEQGTLKTMINQTIFAVAQTDIKPILTGELFEIKDGEITLAAIDGYRLAVRNEETNISDNYSFVVPAKALREIAGLLTDKKDATCEICKSNKHIVFSIGEYSIFSRLLEGEFHNYRGSIPQVCPTEVLIKTRDFMDSLERCSLLINEKMKSPVKCIFENGKIEINCSTAMGKMHEEIEADMSGPMVEIGFNCKYMLDALKATETDLVKLCMNSSTSPIKIIPSDGNSFTFLVLPVKLKAGE